MAEEGARDYLAARVLTEGQPVCSFCTAHISHRYRNSSYKLQVTYRLLARAIQVHVNTAKWCVCAALSDVASDCC